MAKTGRYGAGTAAETQLVEIKEGVKDPQIIGAIAGIYNLLEGFDTDMTSDRSFIPTIKKYRRLRVAGILQAMVLGHGCHGPCRGSPASRLATRFWE